MTAQFPSAIFTPRTKENKTGVEYDAEKTKTIFAEDFQSVEAEVVAVETRLKSYTDTPLGFGFRVGNSSCYFEFNSAIIDGGTLPKLTFSTSGGGSYPGIVMPDTIILPQNGDGLSIIAFLDDTESLAGALLFIASLNFFMLTCSLSLQEDDADCMLVFNINDEYGDSKYSSDIVLQNSDGRICVGDSAFFGDSVCEAKEKFACDSKNGLTTTYDIVSNVRLNSGSLEKKTKTITVTGGIITNIGTESDWQST